VWVAMAAENGLAKAKTVTTTDLRREVFVGAAEADVPGNNRWVSQVCKRAGFRARFVQDAESLAHGMSLVVTEGAVALLPGYVRRQPVPGVVFRELKDASATWELMVAWQRGKPSAALKTLLEALAEAER
jgi:DNA-binding transcriptional LysR family regulator